MSGNYFNRRSLQNFAQTEFCVKGQTCWLVLKQFDEANNTKKAKTHFSLPKKIPRKSILDEISSESSQFNFPLDADVNVVSWLGCFPRIFSRTFHSWAGKLFQLPEKLLCFYQLSSGSISHATDFTSILLLLPHERGAFHCRLINLSNFQFHSNEILNLFLSRYQFLDLFAEDSQKLNKNFFCAPLCLH